MFKDEYEKYYQPLLHYWRDSRLEEDLKLKAPDGHPVKNTQSICI